MLRSTARYAAGLAVWTAAAVAAAQIVRTIAHWSYRDGRSYTAYVFNDLSIVFYACVAIATFAVGALVFCCTARWGRRRLRVLMLAVLVPALLALATSLGVTLLALLQAADNGDLVHPMALLSVFPTATAIAAMDLAVPGLLASAIWSWFFCRR
jgi:membrane associated rhomboid family serine protease